MVNDMNPLMTESEIIGLIDSAVEWRKQLFSNDSNEDNLFITVRLKLGNRVRDFSDIKNMRWEYDGTKEDLITTMFDASLKPCYISNVRPITKNTLRVNLKRATHGRDTNYGANTIDKLVSAMKKET
jgi:hypothetical protein